MYKVVVAAATTETNVAPKLKWSTYNKHFDTVDDPHLFINQFEIETSTDTMHSLTWKQKELRDSRFKNPRHQRFKNGDQSGKVGEDADIIHRICCPSGLFSSILLVIITLTLQILEKIVTLSRVIGIITREFYIMKIGFKLLGDNIKVFYKQG